MTFTFKAARLGLQFKGDVAQASRMWLRKEIIREALRYAEVLYTKDMEQQV